VVQIMAGDGHSLALTSDGHVVAWGRNSEGQTNPIVELSGVAAITANLVLMNDGRVIPRDGDLYGHEEVFGALSNVVALAESGGHYLALTSEGRVEEWKSFGQRWEERPGLRNVIAVATGGSLGSVHSLALCADGRVVAWGDNSCGQTSVPRGLSNVVAIAAGYSHSLAMTDEGQVVAWGGNDVFPTQYSSPVDVPSGLSNVVAIAAGGHNSLALTDAGRVAAWGRSSGFWTDWGSAVDVPDGLSNVVAIAAGGGHSLALTGLSPGMTAPSGIGPRFLIATADRPFHHRILARNGAKAYGAQGLPLGMSLDSHTGAISGLPAKAGVYSVMLSVTNSAGSSSWAVTLFVNEPAAPFIPGGMAQAVLGCEFNHSVTAYNAPERHDISGLPGGLIMDTQTGVISGVPMELGDFKLSLTASNRYGMDKRTLTLRVSPLAAWNKNWSQETAPIGLSNVVAVAAGYEHSLALTTEGRVVAWNNYDYSQTDVTDESGVSLGEPIRPIGFDFYGPTSVPDGLRGVVAIATGYSYSLALTDEGLVVAWGTYSTGSNSVPMIAPTGLSNVVAISAGANNCLALTDDGRVVAWGRNSEGMTELAGSADVPIGLSNVVAISAGAAHNLALTAAGRVVAWGDNGDGQTNVPIGLSNVVAIAAGAVNSLALLSDGRVAAWGNSWYGQTNVPSELINVVAIAAGGSQCMALTSAGRVVTWGGIPSEEADGVGALTNVVAISARGSHSMALVRQPTVPAPGLKLSAGMSGLELQANGVPGISCQLLRASQLPGPWFPVEPITFTKQMQRLRTPVGSESAQFFRLLRK
jgi:alpha-tubulin suppressor-like RCC1 family protein